MGKVGYYTTWMPAGWDDVNCRSRYCKHVAEFRSVSELRDIAGVPDGVEMYWCRYDRDYIRLQGLVNGRLLHYKELSGCLFDLPEYKQVRLPKRGEFYYKPYQEFQHGDEVIVKKTGVRYYVRWSRAEKFGDFFEGARDSYSLMRPDGYISEYFNTKELRRA